MLALGRNRVFFERWVMNYRDLELPELIDFVDFWFCQIDPNQWRIKAAAFDGLLSDRFGHLLQQATAGELYAWRQTPMGRLAEVIVLDQLSRNIYRNEPRAFAQDAMALALAQEAVAAGHLNSLDVRERIFLLMPYMHSESRLIHVQAENLFRQHTPAENHGFELRHKVVVDRFGRYPHRNVILDRPSTAEEFTFLQQPGSSF